MDKKWFWEWLAYPKWYVEDCTVHSPARPHSLALNRNSHEFSREGIISCTAGRRPAAAPLQETSGCDRRANCYGDIPSARHHPLVSRRGHPWSRWAHPSPNSSKIFQSCLLRPFVLSLQNLILVIGIVCLFIPRHFWMKTVEQFYWS